MHPCDCLPPGFKSSHYSPQGYCAAADTDSVSLSLSLSLFLSLFTLLILYTLPHTLTHTAWQGERVA